MLIHVDKAKYVCDYKIWIRFNNGVEGIVDLEKELYGEVFEPLKDFKNFRNFEVDPIMETIVWGNGADFAPEFLLEKLCRTA